MIRLFLNVKQKNAISRPPIYSLPFSLTDVNSETMDKLQRLLHQENSYYSTFKALAELDPEEIDNKVIILSNIKPANSKDHDRQWNKPIPNVNEVI